MGGVAKAASRNCTLFALNTMTLAMEMPVVTEPIQSWTGEWMLAEIPPRFTDDVESRLQAMGCRVYTPRQQAWAVRHGNRQLVSRPLFPGYVAACLPNISLRLAVRYCHHVYDVIYIHHQQRFIEQMTVVQEMLRSGGVESYPGLVEGARVRVIAGPLQGKEGYLETRGNHDRFAIRLEILGQSVSTEIDAALLEAI